MIIRLLFRLDAKAFYMRLCKKAFGIINFALHSLLFPLVPVTFRPFRLLNRRVSIVISVIACSREKERRCIDGFPQPVNLLLSRSVPAQAHKMLMTSTIAGIPLILSPHIVTLSQAKKVRNVNRRNSIGRKPASRPPSYDNYPGRSTAKSVRTHIPVPVTW